MKIKQYGGIEGLKTFACVSIVMMHMASKTNNVYNIDGIIYNIIIPSFTDFVFLFMVISSFGMCCGYYEKILNCEISLNDFYKKRYVKTFPFFFVLVIFDLISNFNMDSLYESIADISLVFGLFPNNITVIGVGWFLGVIFAFYLLFPFFCVLILNKRRAWMILIFSMVLNYICDVYFQLDRKNIIYSTVFFLVGGLIFLYKDEIERLKSHIAIIILTISIFTYFILGANTLTRVIVSASFLIFALCVKSPILQNKITFFISNISMEIYLSHMFVFRVIEKINFNYLIGTGIMQYLLTLFLVLFGTIIYTLTINKFINKVKGIKWYGFGLVNK